MKDLDESEVAEILREAFAEQSAAGFSSMEEALLALERNPGDQESLRTIFRVCHTLKGDSQSLGYEALAEFAHALEDILAAIRNAKLSIDSDLVSLLLDALDISRQMASDAMEGRTEDSPGRDEILVRIRDRLENVTDEPTDQRVEGNVREDLGSSSGAGVVQTLRVQVDLLDRLLNLVGEISIGRRGLTERLASDNPPSIDSLLEIHQELDPLVSELQEAVMVLRLVPVAPLFRQQERLVRDSSLSENKEVRLVVQGDGAELDTTIVDHLRDPLSHMIRNCIAHGIESPDDRERAGKEREGVITLSAVREGGTIIVDVRDDGRGLDADRIRQRALGTGLILEDDSIAEQELCDLIFEPGFSTADEASRIAGRGVGMDVVRKNVEEVGGIVSVESEPGQGTHFRIELPLTVAIVDALGVGVGGEEYVVPLSVVVECLELPAGKRSDSLGGVIELRGRPLPFVRLSKLLGTDGTIPLREHVVVVQHRGERAGIAVDVLYGECQAVVKPLDSLFRDIEGVAGTTIRSDGRVALILDAPALLRAAVGWRPGGGVGIQAEEESKKAK